MDKHTSRPRAGITRREALRWGAVGMGGLVLPSALAACGSNDSSGVTTGIKTTVSSAALAPFDPNVPAGARPTNLAKIFGLPGAFDDAQSLAFSAGIKRACEQRGLRYVIAVADGDIAKTSDQTQQMFAQDICAMFQYPLPATLPLAQQALEKGMCVSTYSRQSSTLQYIEDEAAVGTAMGRAAVQWIKQNAGGKAKVVYCDPVKDDATAVPRHRAVLAELKAGGPDIQIVADLDIEAGTEPAANAFATLYNAHPDINVVIGTEWSAIGAFTVLDSKGRGRDPDIYISVLTAADDALAQIRSGTSSIKAGFLYPWPLMGYGIGQFAADWMEGKSIPRLGVPPHGAVIAVSSPQDVATYQADMRDVAATWADESRRGKYVTYWGNINYEQHASYWRSAAMLPRAAKA